MLTYQLQPRVFKLVDAQPLSFPNELVLEIKYAPGTVFGSEQGYSRALVKGRKAKMLYNANNGRVLAKSDPPVDPIEVTIDSQEDRLDLRGDLLQYRCTCASKEDLEGLISTFCHLLPTLLSLSMPEPPTVVYTKGWLGNIEFRWEHQEARVPFFTVTADSLEQGVMSAIERLPLFYGYNNRRLAAALHYAHKASRLVVSGSSDWEFMSEAILNYCKVLEMLFVETAATREDTRRGLYSLGYDTEAVEGDFIPLFILRGFVDVAHAKVAIHKQEQLLVIYRFLSNTIGRFRELLRKVIENIESGDFGVPVVTNASLDREDRAGMDRLIRILEERINS